MITSNQVASNSAKFGKKGITYTIEAIIAIGLLAAIVLFLFQSPPETSLDLEKQNAYFALSALDADGALREAVFNGSTAAVKAELDKYFQNYDFELCSDVCFGTTVQAQIVEYYMSGWKESYNPKKLRVFLFRP